MKSKLLSQQYRSCLGATDKLGTSALPRGLYSELPCAAWRWVEQTSGGCGFMEPGLLARPVTAHSLAPSPTSLREVSSLLLNDRDGPLGLRRDHAFHKVSLFENLPNYIWRKGGGSAVSLGSTRSPAYLQDVT